MEVRKLIEQLTWFNIVEKLKKILRLINKNLIQFPPIDGIQYGMQDGNWTEIIAPSGGVSSISGDFVNNTDPLNPVLDRGYKVYSAIVNQTGTDAPIFTVLENTLGVTLSPTWNGSGNFLITPDVDLPVANTVMFLGTVKPSANTSTTKYHYTIIHSAVDLFNIKSFQASSSTWSQSDNCLWNNYFEIRVYN